MNLGYMETGTISDTDIVVLSATMQVREKENEGRGGAGDVTHVDGHALNIESLLCSCYFVSRSRIMCVSNPCSVYYVPLIPGLVSLSPVCPPFHCSHHPLLHPSPSFAYPFISLFISPFIPPFTSSFLLLPSSFRTMVG